jgi:serine/threonine protein kinase
VDLSGLKFTSSSTYTIVGEIGRGGMGIVLLAEKNSEGVADLVALKTIRTKSTDHETRLKQEANIATGLRHENIVKTYGLESIPYSQLPAEFLQEFDRLSFEDARRHAIRAAQVPGGKLGEARTKLRIAPGSATEQRLYLMVMDYIEGTDVRTFQNEHHKRDLLIPVPLAGFIVSRIARSLAYAHQTIIHRDISPENLLLNLQGVVKLSDFGVAVDHKEGGLIGKVSYMSPEQMGGEVADLRTDIYSLGLVLYLLLTGIPMQKVPMRMSVDDRVNYARKLIEKPVPAPHQVRTDVPESISEICMKMLARDRDKRYARAEAVARDLEQKYLYAKGFGPTNNSLQAYLEMFDAQFKEIAPEQLQQLPFLHGELKRPVSAALYTPGGKAFLDEVRNR